MASTSRTIATVAALVLCIAQHASAQQQPSAQQPQQPAAQQPQQPTAQQQPAAQQPGARQPRAAEQREAEPVPGTTIETRDYGPESQEPQPPNETSVGEIRSMDRAEVAMDAGMGSPIAYGAATVVELGGSVALVHASETTDFRIAPSVGYFVADNLELTLFPELRILHVGGGGDDTDEGDGGTDATVGAMLEPSYHLPLSDDLYGFLGVGFGFRWAEDPGFDFALRPKIGMDFMIGRSGILKPAFFLDIGANDGLTQGGFEAGFTVML